VHDLHVWTVTSGFPALSAHVLVRQESDCHAARARLAKALSERFGIDHTTLQVDHLSNAGHALKLGAASPRKKPLEPR
jgi:cobalt-zinc-cadmium efflux system protein